MNPVSQKRRTLYTLLLPITLLNIDRFSKFFCHHTQQWLPNGIITKDPTAKTRRYIVKPRRELMNKIISSQTLKWFSYICYDTTVSVLIDFSGCVLLRMLCLPKQFVHHLLPPLQKCNNLRDHGHPYKLPDLCPPSRPDLNPIDYKIWVIIQQRVQCTKVQDVKDLMQCLIDAWAAVEGSIIQTAIGHRHKHLHICIQPQKDIMNIHCDKK